jgi:hypothetical protein
VAQNGLLGVYFNSNNLTLPTVARLDGTVNFDWVNNSPHPALLADGFSARWTGQVTAPSSGVYTFYTQSDDGVRLWLGGQLLIDNWKVICKVIHDHSEQFGFQKLPIEGVIILLGNSDEVSAEKNTLDSTHCKKLPEFFWN